MQNKDKARIIKASARLHLEKETEHFLSDLHGEYTAFECARRFVSGAVRRKIDALFGKCDHTNAEELATVVAFPEEKLALIRRSLGEQGYVEYLASLTKRLIHLAHFASAKHARDTVVAALDAHAGEYADLLGELIFSHGIRRKSEYVEHICRGFRRLGSEEELVVMLASVIRALTAGRLHVVGDIYDRGPHPDRIIDALMREAAVDLTWGNHDALWMSASLGCPASVATAVANSLFYGNRELLEYGYGIELESLEKYADKLYGAIDADIYYPEKYRRNSSRCEVEKCAKMMKVMAIIRAKLEAQIIRRHPEYDMQDNILLENIRGNRIFIQNKAYSLRDAFLPTVSRCDPYSLTDGEEEIVSYLSRSFTHSERLLMHTKYLADVGSIYLVSNENLIFHGCVPLSEDGTFMPLAAGEGLAGRALMDHFDARLRAGFATDADDATRRDAAELGWFLWCGKNSPLAGRERMTSLERLLVRDPETHVEPRNAYYRAWNDPALVDMILREFGLTGTRSHVINGHIPVKFGESPIKADGKLIVIDGGFSAAYYQRTGIGGYTLIYNSEGMRLVSHKPFISRESIIKNNGDVILETDIFEKRRDKIRVRETDEGAKIREWLTDKMGN